MNMLFIGGIGSTELILIVVVLLLVFGGTKLPELMRGAGRGIREFKDAVNGNLEDDKKADNEEAETKVKAKAKAVVETEETTTEVTETPEETKEEGK